MGTNPQVSITADVTHWPHDLRQELEEAIRQLDARAVANLTGLDHHDLDDVPSTGWTQEAYLEAMKGLLGKHFVQANVINEAIKTGTGTISRDKVYELGGYDESRSLKGFTRPVNRIQADLEDRGMLPEEAADLLAPIYPPGTGYSRATGFRVPLENRQAHARGHGRVAPRQGGSVSRRSTSGRVLMAPSPTCISVA